MTLPAFLKHRLQDKAAWLQTFFNPRDTSNYFPEGEGLGGWEAGGVEGEGVHRRQIRVTGGEREQRSRR